MFINDWENVKDITSQCTINREYVSDPEQINYIAVYQIGKIVQIHFSNFCFIQTGVNVPIVTGLPALVHHTNIILFTWAEQKIAAFLDIFGNIAYANIYLKDVRFCCGTAICMTI